MSKKKEETYPSGWDEARIRKLAEHYDKQTEDEQVSEHEAAFLAEGQPSWSCHRSWFRRSSDSSARNGLRRVIDSNKAVAVSLQVVRAAG